MGQSTPINKELALLDASLVIVGAVQHRRTIAASHEAKLIIKRHPDCNLTEEEVAAVIVQMARERGLATVAPLRVDGRERSGRRSR